jgi:hypothetical protein
MLVQQLVPNEIAWLAFPIPKKSSCDKILGERLCARAGTLRGAALLTAGVTTLKSSREV